MYFNVYNTVYNIKENNNTCCFTTVDLSITKDDPYKFSPFNLHEIPVGSRELKNINSCLQDIVGKDDKGVPFISIEADLSTSKCKLITRMYVRFL